MQKFKFLALEEFTGNIVVEAENEEAARAKAEQILDDHGLALDTQDAKLYTIEVKNRDVRLI